jgi:SAM-dependent methyltransferase
MHVPPHERSGDGVSGRLFDNIICVELLCTSTPAPNSCEAHRVLKPNGKLVLSDPILPRWRPDQPLANYVNFQYEQACRQAGFGDVKVIDATENVGVVLPVSFKIHEAKT